MRWSVPAIVLGGLSFSCSMACVIAVLLGVMPARGGEALLTFAGISLLSAVLLAIAACTASALAWLRPWSTARGVVAIFGLVSAGTALLTSGALLLIWMMLTGVARVDAMAAAEGKARHERPLSKAELASAHPMTADALAKDWMLDHDRTDQRYAKQTLELDWLVGGEDWLDGTSCAYLFGHGDVVCCFAAGTTAPKAGKLTLLGRYAGTDRSHDAEGKLVLEGCQVK